MTWNIGYAALGDNADFFMDGGKSVTTASNDRVLSNMSNIASGIKAVHPDIVMIQEIDRDSTRSHHINEFEWFRDQLGGTSSFANNFKVAFLPYPVPPIGKVDSGIATFTSYPVASAERVQLPVPFKWPVRIANLKRCVLVSRIPLDGTDKELVLFNLHLEAYDDGSGKTAQTKMLAGLLKAETDKGNYVIAGGDFNQIFSSEDTSLYPAQPGKWQAGEIDVESFGKGWQFLMDEEVPTCRSLDQPYDGADKETFQYYLIDGFIVSGNIKVDKLATQDLGFVASDHNPVVMTIELKGE
jgi:endonuclease/exonuclease/phosphatase family metal-dependent hydrolase